MAKTEMTIEQVLALLDRRIEQAGGVRSFARLVGVSPQYISSIRGQITPPSDRVLSALGVRRIYVSK
jgi:hypothetical protein